MADILHRVGMKSSLDKVYKALTAIFTLRERICSNEMRNRPARFAKADNE